MIKISEEQIILMHKKLIERYGGQHGVRDYALLASALNTPYQGFGGLEFYPTIIEKAVRLCVGLVVNHPFCDGNKRIGALALLTPLDINGLTLTTNNEELSEIILKLASGTIEYKGLLKWTQERIS